MNSAAHALYAWARPWLVRFQHPQRLPRRLLRVPRPVRQSHHQQDMDQPAERVGREQSEHPQEQDEEAHRQAHQGQEQGEGHDGGQDQHPQADQGAAPGLLPGHADRAGAAPPEQESWAQLGRLSWLLALDVALQWRDGPPLFEQGSFEPGFSEHGSLEQAGGQMATTVNADAAAGAAVGAMAEAATTAPAIRLDGVEKVYRTDRIETVALSNVNLEVGEGELVAIMGPSGCGKSTLLRMLAGFETPTSGRIVLDGVELGSMPPYQRPMNMMFQSYALFPHLSVWDNIAFGLKREGLPKERIAERVEAMLKLVQLGKYAKRKPHQLSGGQQQRVALARSLAKQPQLLLLDEPLGALDKKLREETQIELVNIIESVGVTCVMVTHDQEEAMTMASRIAVMSEGRFLQVGAPGDIYETPATRFVADFIGNVNLMDGTLDVDEADHCIIGSADCRHYVGHGITGVVGMPVTVALRPEKIHLSRHKPGDDFNSVAGTIKEMAYFGSFTVYHLELPSGARLKVSLANVQRHRDDEFTWGDAVWAHWSRSSHVVLTQ